MKNKNLFIVKQVVGIDVGKDSFYACYKIQYEDNSIVIKGTKSFANTPVGLDQFYQWCTIRNKTPKIKPIYIMEATGVYYEELAYFLNNKKEKVSVQLAQKIKYFAKSCNLKTKTDKVDSKMIAQFGIEKNLQGTDIWTPPSKEFKIIRDLSREHTSLKQSLTAAKSQQHALNHSHGAFDEVIELKARQIEFYDDQIIMVENKIKNLVELDNELHSKIKKISTVKGLSFVTIIKILAETNGFLLFNNIRQLVSYAGLDVIEKESGNFKGKTKISKKGNGRIRSALYMPAISASQYNQTLKTFYNRINEGRTTKKQGVVAVMRKLLILIYTLWKKDEEYIENYQMA
ncbi:MAG: transposase [Salinivirgaceae bacterium]|jgi:transposase|nr:transposase [Salinivirgaceae bacterium]